MGLAIALLTVSDTRSLADDSSGDALQQALLAAGHQLQQRQLVPDDRYACLLYTSPSPRDRQKSRMPSSA